MESDGLQVRVVGCAVCASVLPFERVRAGNMTCSDVCHERLVANLEAWHGTHKKVVDATSGIAHKVPTRDLVERGLRYADLPNYPVWEDVE